MFPDEFSRNPDKAIESTFTAGGIAEVMEEEYERTHEDSKVTPLRRSSRRARRLGQLGDSSEPRVSKTS